MAPGPDAEADQRRAEEEQSPVLREIGERADDEARELAYIFEPRGKADETQRGGGNTQEASLQHNSGPMLRLVRLSSRPRPWYEPAGLRRGVGAVGHRACDVQ